MTFKSSTNDEREHLVPGDGLNPDQRARKRYLGRANIPVAPPRMSLTDYSDKVVEAVTPFVTSCINDQRDTPGKGLLLYGPPGTGKSTVAISILTYILRLADRTWLGKAEFDAFRPGYYVPHTEFIALHHDSWRSDDHAEMAQALLRSLYFRSMSSWENTRLLILDDVGKENPTVGTGHKSQVMNDITRARYGKGAPTILTTNYKVEAWPAAYGDATASFMHEAFYHVEMTGRDRRRA